MRPLSFRATAHRRRAHIATGAAVSALLWLSAAALAQTPAPHAHPPAGGQTTATSAQDADLQKQLAELRAQLAKLQAALDRQQKQSPQTPAAGTQASPAQPTGGRMMGEMGGMSSGMSGGMQMGEMGGMKSGGMGAGQPGAMSGGMGMMDMDMHKGEMGMPPAGMKMPDNMMMGEMGTGQMPGASNTQPSGGMAMGTGGASAASPAARSSRAPRSMSSLPGMPGASHVYHIGSTGFFLDQPQLKLTAQQQAALNRIKERTLIERANAERRIDQAEQELWALTGADQPDAAKVETKLQEIERLRTTQRIGFIRAVGEATQQLTPEQQNALLGAAKPAK